MAERPGPGDFFFALRYLTILPAPSWPGRLGPATLFFPIVGLLIGGLVAGGDLLWQRFDVPGRALVDVAFLASLGRGLGLRGLGHLGDSLRFWRDRGRSLEAMESTTVGVPGRALVLAAVLVKLCLLWRPGPLMTWALLFAPMLGRWGMVIAAFSARRARVGAAGPRYDGDITFREFGWASVLAAGTSLVWLEAVGLVAVLGVVAVSVILRLLWHRRLGGLTEVTFFASGEIAEIVALGAFALLMIR